MIKPDLFVRDATAAEVRTARSASIQARYRKSQVFGLLLLAGIILAAVLYRADPLTLFPPGWWR